MLAIVAGGSVGLGALYYTIVVSDAEMSFAAVRVGGGLAFSLGAGTLLGGARVRLTCGHFQTVFLFSKSRRWVAASSALS